jgi:hypothetical protein
MNEEIPVQGSEEDQAHFTEVFQVEVRSDSFKEGLRLLKLYYDEWVAGLGGDATGLVGAGISNGLREANKASMAFAESLEDRLGVLTTRVQLFSDRMGTSLETAMSKAATRIEVKLKDTSDSVTSAAAQAQLGADAVSQRTPRIMEKANSGKQKEQLPSMQEREDSAVELITAGSRNQPNLVRNAFNSSAILSRIKDLRKQLAEENPGEDPERLLHDRLTNDTSSFLRSVEAREAAQEAKRNKVLESTAQFRREAEQLQVNPSLTQRLDVARTRFSAASTRRSSLETEVQTAQAAGTPDAAKENPATDRG